MSMVAASHHDTILECSLAYVEMGLSILPVRGKQPAVAWSQFQTKRAPYSFVHNWQRANLLPGVGIVCGQVSGNLSVMDCDGLEAVATFERTFPHLLDTFTVVSGSGNGKHYYYFTTHRQPTTRTKGFELRSDGCYVVAPPSIHPVSGKTYVPNRTEIRTVPNLAEIEIWIKDMIGVKQLFQKTEMMQAIKNDGYGRVALSGECERVARATSNVNSELNLAAFRLGRLVQRGYLDYGQCESALLISARHLSARDGEHATIKTIKSGLNAGMARENGTLRRNQ